MDWCSTLFGAAIGFVASVGTIIAQRIIDRAGKLKLYCVTVRGDSAINSIGFSASNFEPGTVCFYVPIKLEIQNTANTTRVIRDVSMWLYLNGKPVKEMLQVQTTKHCKTKGDVTIEKDTTNYGGDKNMYSFVIPPRSIQREHCSYALKINNCETQQYFFDEIKLSYFDERDKMHLFFVKKIEDPWRPRLMNGDDDWIQLKER